VLPVPQDRSDPWELCVLWFSRCSVVSNIILATSVWLEQIPSTATVVVLITQCQVPFGQGHHPFGNVVE
jgi:hypothetical protein